MAVYNPSGSGEVHMAKMMSGGKKAMPKKMPPPLVKKAAKKAAKKAKGGY